MKCPKCGYNSFEIHDTCKKCANDLTSYKNIHGLKSIVLPFESRAVMAEKMMADKMSASPAAVAEVPVDMFSFDTTEAEAASESGAFVKEDPFDFSNEQPTNSFGDSDFSFGKEQMAAQAKAEEDAFADLLESSIGKVDESSATKPAVADQQAGSDLNDFNWDDTPDPTPGGAAKPAEDDFNSLFGDTDDTATK